jgi:hypothetical protein
LNRRIEPYRPPLESNDASNCSFGKIEISELSCRDEVSEISCDDDHGLFSKLASGWSSSAESRDRSEARDWFPCGLGVESAEIDESEEPATDRLDGDPTTLVSSTLAAADVPESYLGRGCDFGALLNFSAAGDPVAGEPAGESSVVSLVRGAGAKDAAAKTAGWMLCTGGASRGGVGVADPICARGGASLQSLYTIFTQAGGSGLGVVGVRVAQEQARARAHLRQYEGRLLEEGGAVIILHGHLL